MLVEVVLHIPPFVCDPDPSVLQLAGNNFGGEMYWIDCTHTTPIYSQIAQPESPEGTLRSHMQPWSLTNFAALTLCTYSQPADSQA